MPHDGLLRTMQVLEAGYHSSSTCYSCEARTGLYDTPYRREHCACAHAEILFAIQKVDIHIFVVLSPRLMGKMVNDKAVKGPGWSWSWSRLG